jgi:hypothetical protein
MEHKIAVPVETNNILEAVILYSSNDSKFASACIESLLKLNIRVHVITYTHMWNGAIEDVDKLQKPLNQFVENTLFNQYSIEWEEGHSPWYWEGLGRYLGTQEVSDQSEYILYIDIDEIVDTEKFENWIISKDYQQHDALKLSTYWYWREPIYQAHQLEDSVVMLRTNIAKQLPLQPGGREIYFNSTSNSIRSVGNEDPMIHHYSWVRTKEEMLNKVSNWGHTDDRKDWTLLVEKEFSSSFSGTDFLHNYQYRIVENKFKIK